MTFFNNNIYLELRNKYLTITRIDSKQNYNQDTFALTKTNIAEVNLASYLKELNYKVKKASIIIPNQQLLIKTLNLPLTAKERVEKIIQFQVIEKSSYEQEDIYWMYQLNEGKEKLSVIVFMLTKNYLNQLFALFKKNNIRIKTIIPESLIIYHLRQDNCNQKQAKLYIDLSNGGQHYTFLGAEDIYIRTTSADKDFVREVEKTLSYLKDKFSIEDNPNLIVNGQQLNYSDLKTKDNIKELDRENNFFERAKAVERDIKGRDFKSKLDGIKAEREKSSYRIVWLLIILILVINILSLQFNYQLKKKRLKTIKKQVDHLTPAVKQINNLKEKVEFKAVKVDLLESIVDFNYNYLPWLKELSLILDDKVRINKLNFKDDKLVLLSAEASSAVKVMSKLEKSPYFTNLHFISSIEIREASEEFKIAGDLSNEDK